MIGGIKGPRGKRLVNSVMRIKGPMANREQTLELIIYDMFRDESTPNPDFHAGGQEL